MCDVRVLILVRVARIILARQELLPGHVLDTKALSLTRVVCGFEAWPLVAQVGELAKDGWASAAGVAAGLVLEANDISRAVVVKGHLVGVVVCTLVCYRRW